MQQLLKKQSDPQYLKTVLAQRQIMIQQCQKQKVTADKEIKMLNGRVSQLEAQIVLEKNRFGKQSTNMAMAVKQVENQNEEIRQQKNELEFQLNIAKMKIQQQAKEHAKQLAKLKNDYESQKDSLVQQISKLQKNLSALKTHYNVQYSINEDKQKIIEDANRNLRGFANEKQQRMIILQNQQLANEIEFQSRQITSLLQKNEKFLQEIKQYKMDLDLHKSIENDLVKRSSLAQNLIKQLNHRIKQLENKLSLANSQKQKALFNSSVKESKVSQRRSIVGSGSQSRVSQTTEIEQKLKDMEEKFKKLKFQNSNLKNYNVFLENLQKNGNKKYENLGEIMSQYLQTLLYKSPKQSISENQIESTLSINLQELREKPINQWKPEQTETILNLLITQIKPYISVHQIQQQKASLIKYPEIKNIKVSFMEQENKDSVSLPRIVQEYEKNQEKDGRKVNRFKDIPVDISTKILRSNLREWGVKVNHGNNLPRGRRQASKSIMVEGEKNIF